MSVMLSTLEARERNEGLLWSTENQNMRRGLDGSFTCHPRNWKGTGSTCYVKSFKKQTSKTKDEFTGIIYFIVHFPVLSCILRGLL